MSIVNLQYTDWNKEVLATEKPVVVEFWHETCPICIRVEPTFRQIPDKLGPGVKVARLNVLENRENKRLAIEKGIIGTPTIKVYCKGNEVGELVGLEVLEVDLVETLKGFISKCG